jgi:formate dehydrogenase major subunit
MTLHHPDKTLTNLLTINATDPVSGTAEFKCTAVAVEKLGAESHGQAARSAEHGVAAAAGARDAGGAPRPGGTPSRAS